MGKAGVTRGQTTVALVAGVDQGLRLRQRIRNALFGANRGEPTQYFGMVGNAVVATILFDFMGAQAGVHHPVMARRQENAGQHSDHHR